MTGDATKLVIVPFSDAGEGGTLLRLFFSQSPASTPARYAFAAAQIKSYIFSTRKLGSAAVCVPPVENADWYYR